jgi:hypothetical protein
MKDKIAVGPKVRPVKIILIVARAPEVGRK